MQVFTRSVNYCKWSQCCERLLGSLCMYRWHHSMTGNRKQRPRNKDRHASPGGLEGRNQGVVAVSGDLSDAVGESHQGNPHRVQLLQLERAVLGLGDVVRSVPRL